MKYLFAATFLLITSASFSQSLSTEKVEKIKNCTVRIFVDTVPVGTGFLVNNRGFAFTCWHVASLQIIRGANNAVVGFKKMYIQFRSGEKVEVGIHNFLLNKGNKEAVANDYCIIVPVAGVTKPTQFLKLGVYDSCVEGQEVYTCGYPLGIAQQFISKGIISTKYINKENYVISAQKTDTLPRKQALVDLTMNRGNSGGAIMKVGNATDEDEVIGIADFIISPMGSSADALINKLEKASGGVTISGVDPNDTFATLTKVLSNTSIGVSGFVSIEYPIGALAAIGR